MADNNEMDGNPANWQAAGPYTIVGARGGTVATFSGPHKAARRAFVLRACQMHAALVNTLAELAAAAAEFQAAQEAWDEADLHGSLDEADSATETMATAAIRLTAALAAAKEEARGGEL